MEAVTPRPGTWRRRILRVVADAGVWGICGWFLTDFFFSIHAQRLGMTDLIKRFGFLWLICILVSVVSLYATLKGQTERKEMILHFLLCIPAHILFIVLVLVNYLSVHIQIFPPGDFHDAYGILYAFAMGPYFGCTVLLRLGIFLIHLMGAGKQPGIWIRTPDP